MGRRVCVTGGSRGIGAAIVTACCERGDRVVFTYRSREDAASSLCETLRSRGFDVQAHRVDVCDGEAMWALFAALGVEDDPFQVVIVNAGITDDVVFGAMGFESWERVTRTSLDGFYHTCRPLIMPMLRTRWGRIVSISSVSGRIGQKGQVHYSAAKAGLIGASKALAREVAKRGVTVNVVAPGLVDTDMVQGLDLDVAKALIPAARVGRAEEVAAAVVFLTSESAGYITGQVLGVDGGLT